MRLIQSNAHVTDRCFKLREINHSFILYLFLQCLLQLADAVHKLNTKNTSYTKSKHTCASPHISRFSTSFISPNTPGNAPRNKLIGVVIGWMCCVYCEHVDHLLFARNMCKYLLQVIHCDPISLVS
eukprot:427697_1